MEKRNHWRDILRRHNTILFVLKRKEVGMIETVSWAENRTKAISIRRFFSKEIMEF